MLQTLLAYLYSTTLSQRIKKVINLKQKIGSYTPARLPFGYKKVYLENEVLWELDENTAPTIRLIFERASSGLSLYSIASELNKKQIPAPNSMFWSSNSVLRILRNESYTGVLTTGKTRNDITAKRKIKHLPPSEWIRHRGHHAPIVDDILFSAVQSSLSRLRTLNSNRTHTTIDFFDGKLYCGICGRKLKLKHAANGGVYYICPRRDESAGSCFNKANSVKKLKKLVLLKLSEIAAEQQRSYEIALAYENSLFFQTRITEHERLLQHYDSEIKRQDTLFQKVYEGMIENHSITSSDMQELMRYLRRVRDDLHNRISAILREQEDYRQYESTDSEKYKLFIELGGHDGLTSELIESFIKRIDVDLVGVRVII